MALLDAFLDPGPLSPAVRPSFRREQFYELSMPVAIGLMEGGFIGVVAAKAFDAPAWVIAVTSAAPMFGNLSSFVWNRIAAGRPKVPMALALQAVVLLCVLAIALSPRNETGVWVLLVAVVTSRLCISGIVTVRSVAWSLNYERLVRARMIGRLQALSSLTFVVTTGLGALLLDAHPESHRLLYGVGVLAGSLGVWAFSGVRLEGEKRQQVLERRRERDGSGGSGFFAILKSDRDYARYQHHQFVSGFAAMMLEPPLVYLVSRQIGATYLQSIVVVMVIPFLLNLLLIPWWARRMARRHVAGFRARQTLWWSVGVLLMGWGALTLSLGWLVAGRLLTSIVNAGSTLAWQIGHNDFAPRDQLSAYMGIHVTLTGLRGALAPFLGMALYLGWRPPGLGFDLALGAGLFLMAALMGLYAWRGFHELEREIRQRPAPQQG